MVALACDCADLAMTRQAVTWSVRFSNTTINMKVALESATYKVADKNILHFKMKQCKRKCS